MPSIADFVADPELLRKIDPDIKVHYSQLGEEVVVLYALYKHFGKTDPGFYIDVGAHHPTKYSTTAILYHYGWRGINIDASEGAIEALGQARPRDVSILAGVAREHRTRPFFVFDPLAVSTFDPATRDEWQANGWTLRETKALETRPLSEILTTHLARGQAVDYLNIDIEGLDLEALETYDFANYAPSVITIELHQLDLLAARENPVVKFLVDRGYLFHSYIAITALFVRMT